MKLLYKYQGKEKLVVVGDLNEQEIKQLQHEGYKIPRVQKNKHGIRVMNDERS